MIASIGKIKKIFMHPRAKLFGMGLNIFIAIFAVMLWCGAVGNTSAINYDSEKSQKNKFAAGELDMALASDADFSPQVLPTQESERAVKVKNEGGLIFDYELETINISGELCPNLKFKADWQGDGSDEYSGDIAGFIDSAVNLEDEDLWNFSVSLKDDGAEWEGQKCEFDIQARARQRYGLGKGFSDYEVIHNKIETGTWTESPGVTAPTGLSAPAEGEIIETPENNLGVGGTQPETIQSDPVELPVETEVPAVP